MTHSDDEGLVLPPKLAPIHVVIVPIYKGAVQLNAIAEKANPIVKFYDPLNLAEADFYGMGNEATIGFLRQSEIKVGTMTWVIWNTS